MSNIEDLEKRWKELANKPKSKSEIAETLELAKKLELERAKEYSGLIKELSEVGIQIKSIWDLVNTKKKYPEAIGLLIKYLPLVRYDGNKEGIIRALTVSEAKGVAMPLLLKEYLNTPKEQENLRWVIGNAVFATITKEYTTDVINIVLDPSNGDSRQMFIWALAKVRTEGVDTILYQLTLDSSEIIKNEAVKVIEKLLVKQKTKPKS